MKSAAQKLTPRKWWLLPAVLVFLSVVCFSLLVFVAVTGIKRQDCPCEEPEDNFDVKFGKECCIHFTEYDFCTKNECLCATPENIATYDHVTGSVYTKFSANNIYCKAKEKKLKDSAIIGVTILAVSGVVFLAAAAVSMCCSPKKKEEKTVTATAEKVVAGGEKEEATQSPEGASKAAPNPKGSSEGVAAPEVLAAPHAAVQVVKNGEQPSTQNQYTDTAKI